MTSSHVTSIEKLTLVKTDNTKLRRHKLSTKVCLW